MDGDEQRFPFGPRPGLMVLTVVGFGGSGALLAHAASTGHPVRLFPLATTVTGTPVYILSALSFGFAALAIAAVVRGLWLGPRELVIAPGSLEMPRNAWTHRRVRIEKSAVLSVQNTETMGTRVLTIVTADDKVAVSNRTVGEDGYAAVLRWLGS